MAEFTDVVLDGVERLGVFIDPRRLDPSQCGGLGGLEGHVEVEGRSAVLRLVLPVGFPARLPRFYLQPWDALGFIPHVLPESGYVCYLDREGVLLDRRRPVEVVADALARTLTLLSDGVSGRNRTDFVDEFDVWWQRLPEAQMLISVLDPPDEVCRLVLVRPQGKDGYLARSASDISAFFGVDKLASDWTVQRALYVPFEPGTMLVPPRPDGAFWSVERIRELVFPALSPENRRRLERCLRRRARETELVIFRLPRTSAGATLFGIRYVGVRGRHPLSQGEAERVIPVSFARWDRDFLLARGGADRSLTGKRVVLAGCGAVGGHLAFELARAGVLALTLVDPDKLHAENTFRHVLGRAHWGESKATALKEEIERALPYARIDAVVDTIEHALVAGKLNIRDFDLVVLALGDPTIDLLLNEIFRSVADAPPLLFTWLEPLGIGGHAVLVSAARGPGCLECLYTPPTDAAGTELENRAAFAAPGQRFGRDLSGCGTLHTPFGSMDAVRTAGLAARLAVDALTGREPQAALRSWKGNAADFLAAGFRLSERHAASEAELARQEHAFASPRCQICGAAAQEAA